MNDDRLYAFDIALGTYLLGSNVAQRTAAGECAGSDTTILTISAERQPATIRRFRESLQVFLGNSPSQWGTSEA